MLHSYTRKLQHQKWDITQFEHQKWDFSLSRLRVGKREPRHRRPEADSVPIPERAEAGIVRPVRRLRLLWRTYDYPRHVALLALVEQGVVAEGAHVALPRRRRPLARVYVAVEVARIVPFWKVNKGRF